MQVRLTRDLSALRSQAIRQVDEAAERRRQAILTPGDGQATVYSLKLAEAAAYLQAGAPVDLGPYPLLGAEVGVTAASAAAVAALWQARAADSRVALARIEGRRLAAKSAISSATTPAGIAAAAQIDWEA